MQRPPRRPVTANTLLLLDSGGQYDCGTTDITRTMHLGTPDDYQRRCYTRVLQGHIGLDKVCWRVIPCRPTDLGPLAARLPPHALQPPATHLVIQ